jgi:hypothetical protein
LTAATQGWSGIHPRQFDAPWRHQQCQQHLDALARLHALEHSEVAGESTVDSLAFFSRA